MVVQDPGVIVHTRWASIVREQVQYREFPIFKDLQNSDVPQSESTLQLLVVLAVFYPGDSVGNSIYV